MLFLSTPRPQENKKGILLTSARDTTTGKRDKKEEERGVKSKLIVRKIDMNMPKKLSESKEKKKEKAKCGKTQIVSPTLHSTRAHEQKPEDARGRLGKLATTTGFFFINDPSR